MFTFALALKPKGFISEFDASLAQLARARDL